MHIYIYIYITCVYIAYIYAFYYIYTCYKKFTFYAWGSLNKQTAIYSIEQTFGVRGRRCVFTYVVVFFIWFGII